VDQRGRGQVPVGQEVEEEEVLDLPTEKEDRSFSISLLPHFGHFCSILLEEMPTSNSNSFPHFLHLKVYMGIILTLLIYFIIILN